MYQVIGFIIQDIDLNLIFYYESLMISFCRLNRVIILSFCQCSLQYLDLFVIVRFWVAYLRALCLFDLLCNRRLLFRRIMLIELRGSMWCLLEQDHHILLLIESLMRNINNRHIALTMVLNGYHHESSNFVAVRAER
jgi:hypothetical protein